MSTYTLQIDFVGLCLFANEANRITVLFPSTQRPCCHHDMEAHEAVLYYATVENPTPSQWTRVPLENMDLDLRGVGGPMLDPHIPASVADLYPFTGKMIDRRLVEGLDPTCVESRISLGSGNAIEVPAEASWEFHDRGVCGEGSRVGLSHRMTWKIADIETAPLRLVLKDLTSGSDVPPVEIAPTNGIIRLAVLHVPKPSRPLLPDCTPVHHFACYYGLLPAAGRKPVPRFRAWTNYTAPALNLPKPEEKATDNYTCMLAQAPVGP